MSGCQLFPDISNRGVYDYGHNVVWEFHWNPHNNSATVSIIGPIAMLHSILTVERDPSRRHRI